MTIPLGPTLPPGSSGLPVPPAQKGARERAALCAAAACRATTMGRDLFGLAPGGVCQAGMSPCRWCALTAPFHPYPRSLAAIVGGVFSVALSVRSPSLGVTQHPALRSPDFPPVSTPLGVKTGGHPTDFGHYQRNAHWHDLQPKNRDGQSNASVSLSLRALEGCVAILTAHWRDCFASLAMTIPSSILGCNCDLDNGSLD